MPKYDGKNFYTEDLALSFMQTVCFTMWHLKKGNPIQPFMRW